MPYILVRSSLWASGFVNRTFIDFNFRAGEQGDGEQNALSQLGAECTIHGKYCCETCRGPCSFQTYARPYLVLDELENQGYKVVAANSAADNNRPGEPVIQIWTLHKQA